ncbi:MAG: glycosyl hydrolase family 28-related protein [Micavibrio sp.]
MIEHIKMPAVTPVVRLLADGEETSFVFSFPIFSVSDLKVYLDGALQYSGYDVAGAGETTGGSVTFDEAPDSGVVVTLERTLAYERVTDFLEGGDFSARALNNELDYIVAALQQLSRDQEGMLHYLRTEEPSPVTLPPRNQRAGKALGFDASGHPVAISLEGSMAAPDYTASGMGAETRTSSDKFSDVVSVKDFGAVGDGLTDDTLALQQALTAHSSVFLPTGTYLITAPLYLDEKQALYGVGQSSVIKAQNNSFISIEVVAGSACLANFRIEGGLIGIRLAGRTGPCVQNLIAGLQIVGANTGLQLDGYDDPDKPCYWNNIRDVLIEQPLLHGVHLTLSDDGDTPNANRFYAVRVYSKGAETSGSGFYIEYGQLNNSFIDCEANMNGESAACCFRVGAGSDKTLILNLLCESSEGVPNIQLDDGSVETALINLTAMSDGAAIYDLSDGNYDALNAGWPDKNRLRKTVVTDFKATLLRHDTEYIDTAGTTNLDLSHSVHLVNATGGAITASLPAASDAAGAVMTIKKVDSSASIVTVTEQGGGAGPDGSPLLLGGWNDYVTVISNGASWYVLSSNRLAGNTRYADTTGTYDIDMAVDTYLLSSYGGALIARLPPANAAQAIGRRVTIKKTDVSSNTITITEQGGAGPDQSSQILDSQYEAMTVMSNGAQWYILSKF